jgi:hypothetical protein
VAIDGKPALLEDEVRSIAAIDDPVERNERITEAYRRLSQQLCAFIGGPFANWCTYAVWSSRTIGGALAGRDLPLRTQRLLRRVIPFAGPRARVEARLRAALPRTRTTYAVPLANGNRDIFVEVGASLTRFLAALGTDVVADPEKLETVLEAVQGEVLDAGMATAAPALLREGLAQYYAARFAESGDERSERVLAGSLLIGAYEQRRVQDDVAASFAIGVQQVLGPLARLEWLKRMATPPWSRLMTKEIMSLVIDGDVIALGEPIAPAPGKPALYPATLAHVDSPELALILRRYDPEPGQPVIASDWSVYDDRMRFITAFFRSRQQSGALFRAGDLEGEW